jgi:hypothetical protein
MLAGDLQTPLRFCRTAENPAAITTVGREFNPLTRRQPPPSQQMRARSSEAAQALSESGNHLGRMASDTEAIFLASAILGVAWLAMM